LIRLSEIYRARDASLARRAGLQISTIRILQEIECWLDQALLLLYF